MSNNDYKRYIILMIEKIEDNKVLKRIYQLVQKYYINK